MTPQRMATMELKQTGWRLEIRHAEGIARSVTAFGPDDAEASVRVNPGGSVMDAMDRAIAAVQGVNRKIIADKVAAAGRTGAQEVGL